MSAAPDRPFPWQTQQWRQLIDAHARDRLSHAYLFSGRVGGGVMHFAERFAAYLLCEDRREEAACGVCRGCTLVAAGNHPDLRTVAPIENGKQIGVDQIRELSDFYALTAHYGQTKIAIIEPAEAMNRAAANALLKTLEEPPGGAVLILVCHRVSGIPLTIRSRCQRLQFENIDQTAAREWIRSLDHDENAALFQLAAAMGAPLLAAERLTDEDVGEFEQVLGICLDTWNLGKSGFSASRGSDAIPVSRQIDCLSQLIYEILMVRYDAEPYYGSILAGLSSVPLDDLKALADRINLNDLYDFSDLLFEAKALLMNNANLREADLSDRIWLAFADVLQKPATPSGVLEHGR